MLFKDAILDDLADRANVAQFVSYGPAQQQRFSRLFGFRKNHYFDTIAQAVETLLELSTAQSVNVRSFAPDDAKSREFVYGLKSVESVVSTIRRLSTNGLFTIVNETIDVNDGGVSGVALGDVVEFAPGDTPRCVEKPGTAAFPRPTGLRVLNTVYGFKPALDFDAQTRVEFSIHPIRRGVRAEQTIIWELEEVGLAPAKADIRWPNRFSELIGDKAFGLLIAHVLGLPVPQTVVISRAVAPFSFGRSSSAETWLRTSPRVQVPGRFTTRRGWTDPFALMAAEDPDAVYLASILAQRSVTAEYSGAAIATHGDVAELIIEGVAGFGDRFMVGDAAPERLPSRVLRSINRLYVRAASRMSGPVRFEWAWDGRKTWILQFHRGSTSTYGAAIVPGFASKFHPYDVRKGLEPLRKLVAQLHGTSEGITLIGDVGITSHFGDVLRKAGIPSQIQPPTTDPQPINQKRRTA
jgi:hypothetical protein